MMTATNRRLHPAVVLMLTTFVVQLCFTAGIRLVVVPRLTPAKHWQYGLTQFSDSQAFQKDAVALSASLRASGWGVLRQEIFEGLWHVKILASTYYIAGSDNPWSVYLLNAFVLSFSALLVYRLLILLQVPSARAALGAGVIMCSPLVLFAHSELLREPFVIPQVLLFVLGLCVALEVGGARGFQRAMTAVLGASIAALALIGASLLRPYLLLLLTIAMALVVCGVLALIVVRRSGGVVLEQGLACALVFALLIGLYVRPSMSRVQQYRDASVVTTGASGTAAQTATVVTETGGQATVRLDQFERDVSAKDASALTRADFLVPHWCTVQWHPTPGVPASLDGKFQSLACAREDYQRFCDTSLLGDRADRNCDMTAFSRASDVAWHLPAAARFGLFVPYPQMWLNGFGSHGTGLRRAAYVIDGVLDYALLAGVLLFAWRAGRARPQLLLIAAGLIVMLTIYGMAVPTQFILARLRLAIYLPLLAIGAAGWLMDPGRADLRSS